MNIKSMMLVLTHSCNLHCRYCFVSQKNETMSLQTAKNAIDFLIKNCKKEWVPSINFFGGEPTLCWDSIIVPITKYIREDLKIPFNIGMTSNCTLLNEERLKFMKKNKINLLFSIDGDQETQDFNRPFHSGQGSFNTLVPLIPQIVKNFNPTFRATIIPATCHNTYKNITFAEKNNFKTFFMVPNVFENWSEEKINELKLEMHKYSLHIIECFKYNQSFIRFSTLERSFKDILKINEAINNNNFRNNCSYFQKCGLGHTPYVSVDPQGKIYACQELTSNDKQNIFLIGDIYNGINENSLYKLKESFNQLKIRGKECENCRYNRICDGGCVANNFLINDDINSMPSMFCTWKNILLDEAIFIMNSLSDNKHFIEYWEGNLHGR